jgi:hypothetical protein
LILPWLAAELADPDDVQCVSYALGCPFLRAWLRGGDLFAVLFPDAEYTRQHPCVDDVAMRLALPEAAKPRDVSSDLSGSRSWHRDRYSAKAMDSDLMIPMVAFQLANFPDITAHCTSYALGTAFNTFLETLTAQELARVFTVACHNDRVKELLGDRAEEAATHEKAVIIREASAQVKKFFVGSGNFDDPAILLGLRRDRADRNTNSGVLFSATEPGGLDRLVEQWTAVRLNPAANLD